MRSRFLWDKFERRNWKFELEPAKFDFEPRQSLLLRRSRTYCMTSSSSQKTNDSSLKLVPNRVVKWVIKKVNRRRRKMNEIRQGFAEASRGRWQPWSFVTIFRSLFVLISKAWTRFSSYPPSSSPRRLFHTNVLQGWICSKHGQLSHCASAQLGKMSSTTAAAATKPLNSSWVWIRKNCDLCSSSSSNHANLEEIPASSVSSSPIITRHSSSKNDVL